MPGVYISFPFCRRKCTYCNFASGVYPVRIQEKYVLAVCAEIGSHQWRWTPETLYIGGGTPGDAHIDVLKRILAAVPGSPWQEATIEASPGTFTPEKVRAWVGMGINRVSLGVQSFVEGEVAKTGRRYSPETVSKEVALLRNNGIFNFNIDLIAGLPGQTRASWLSSLKWVERLEAPHVSVYMLEIDEDSRLGREIISGGPRYGAQDAPPDDLVAEFYEMAVDFLERLGIRRYEISNFARPGFESRHNLKYWRLEPYAGFGADAHSFDGRLRWQNVESPEEYIERFDRGESPQLCTEPSNPDEERFFMGLRMTEGIQPSSQEWSRFHNSIKQLFNDGLLEKNGTRLCLTRRGVLLSNEVFEKFIGV